MSLYGQWKRSRGGAKRPDLVAVGKKLLGYLDGQRRLSGVQSMQITRRLPDGSIVRAQFVGDHPSVDIWPSVSGGRERHFRSWALITAIVDATVPAGSADGRVWVYELETYSLPPGGTTLQKLSERNVLVGNVAIGIDPQGLSVSADGRRGYATDYYGFGTGHKLDLRWPQKPSVTQSFVFGLPGATGPFVSVFAGSDVWLSYISSDQAVGRWAANSSAPVNEFLVPSSGASGFGISSARRGRFVFNSLSPNGPTGVIAVLDNGVQVGSITIPSIEGNSYTTLYPNLASADGTRLYAVIDNQTGTVGAHSAGIATFDLSYDASGAYIGATLAAASLGGRPNNLALSPDDRRLYVQDDVNQWAIEYDTTNMALVGDIATVTGAVLTSPYARKFYAANISVFGDVAVSADGKRLYALSGKVLGTTTPNVCLLSVFDVKTMNLLHQIPTYVGPQQIRIITHEIESAAA